MTNDNAAEQLKCREAFETYMLNDVKCIVGSRDPYPSGIEREQWKTWKTAWNAATRADSGEAVAYMLRMPGCFTGPTESDFTIAIQRAIDSMPAGTAIVPLYEHPSATADEVRDAERYRWLRQKGAFSRAAHIAVFTHNGGYVAEEDAADRAIDADLAAKRGESK